MNLFARLEKKSLELGFQKAGGADLEDPHFIALYGEHLRKFESWLNRGQQGEMKYLERGLERRKDFNHHLPGAKSVFCVLESYSAAPNALSKENGPRLARYIRGQDYHKRIYDKLEAVMREVSQPNLNYKIAVDSSAVLERTLAFACGLGWIGKNTMLLNKELGSYFFIGVIFLDQKLDLRLQPSPNLCGYCTRCLSSCPTGAFVGPNDLDSRACLSYQTLEHRGPWIPDQKNLKTRGSWVAGCDVCQEVCPFNFRAMKVQPASTSADPQIALEALSLKQLAYQQFVSNSALSRIKFREYQRNLALSLTAMKLSGELNSDQIKEALHQFESLKDLANEPMWKEFWKKLINLWREDIHSNT